MDTREIETLRTELQTVKCALEREQDRHKSSIARANAEMEELVSQAEEAHRANEETLKLLHEREGQARSTYEAELKLLQRQKESLQKQLRDAGSRHDREIAHLNAQVFDQREQVNHMQIQMV